MRCINNRLYVCKSIELGEREYLAFDLMYAGELQPIIVIRFNEIAYAYINRCVHMPRKLNCERDNIFNDCGNFLRCSMHGIVYDPKTGASQSTMCNGEKLKALKVIEENGSIYLNDKRALAMTNGP